jgi:hypothetical protein
MSNLHIQYAEFLNEAKSNKEPFEIFAKNRLAGASKIAENAESKGGDAMLTYYHFVVKLPVYKQASEGKFKMDKALTTLEKLMQKLSSGTRGDVKMKQVEFQKLVGLIEVWGELIIKYHETH